VFVARELPYSHSCKDRGVIFEASFVRGIRRLYIPAVLSVSLATTVSQAWTKLIPPKLYLKNGDDSGYTLEDIAQMARDLKAETEASGRPPSTDLDPGFYASFWIYPIAEALSYVDVRFTATACSHITEGFLDGITCNSVSDTLIGRWISTQTLLVTL
jgi:hypothetical protein